MVENPWISQTIPNINTRIKKEGKQAGTLARGEKEGKCVRAKSEVNRTEQSTAAHREVECLSE